MLYSVIILTVLLLGCASPATLEPVEPGSAWDLPIVDGPSYVGVIFPMEQGSDTVQFVGIEASEYWTPSAEVIEELESGLRIALERGRSNPLTLDQWSEGDPQRQAFVTREIGKILEHLGDYRRQYVGIVTAEGKKRVFVNCFPGPSMDSSNSYPKWRQSFVVFDDGGFWYWNIQYDVENSRYLLFDSNGYA